MPWSRFSVPLSKWMCCQCLLKQTRISTFQLSNGSHVCWKRIHPKSSLVTWLITLGLNICPSSYKARLNNLIGTANICPQIISPQCSARPNFPTKKCVGGAKFGLVSRLVFLLTRWWVEASYLFNFAILIWHWFWQNGQKLGGNNWLIVGNHPNFRNPGHPQIELLSWTDTRLQPTT